MQTCLSPLEIILYLGQGLVYQEHADYEDIMSCFFWVPINIVKTLFILETQRERMH